MNDQPETEVTWLRLTKGIDKGMLVVEPAQVVLQPGNRWSDRAWMDEDGQHVWCAHDCVDGRMVTMLPWPTWQRVDSGMVAPSFSCDGCGFHGFLDVVWELASVVVS